MPYLSRIWLNPLRPGAQRMLRSPHVLHAAVLGGLSRQPVTERVLWRLESSSPYRADVLVLTDSLPSWEHLVEQGGWPTSDEPQSRVRPYDPLLDRIIKGREFAFRLRANPVSTTRHPQKPTSSQQRRLSTGGRPRGVRVAHRTSAHQMAWLLARLPGWGFEIPPTSDGYSHMKLAERERLVFTKTARGNGHRRVVLDTATFEGRIRVSDPDTARMRLLSGVGAGRAYGCGLITLAPLTSASAGD